jgi:hypothetical protein
MRTVEDFSCGLITNYTSRSACGISGFVNREDTMKALILFSTLLMGCDNFSAVQQTDTIEAYETYLKENPTSRWVIQATSRLELLYLKDADLDKSLEKYDNYVKRFPNGALKARAMSQRQKLAQARATTTNTIEVWETYLKEYPRAEPKIKKDARRAIKTLKLAGQFPVGPITKERVNLAEDEEGALNGWGFWADVTNNSKEEVGRIIMTLVYLDENDIPLDTRRAPVAARYWSVPMESHFYKPMKPGETRTWEFTDGNIPEGWSGKVLIRPDSIIFGPDE